MSGDGERVGVLLVGGFLGAGKTTLLSRLVRDPTVGPRLAVLVNELGSLGLDGELLRGASESAALRTVQLDSGCLCCTLKGELGEALLELARPQKGAPPAQIIVELSGAALASEVHFQVATQALEAPYYTDGLVCVVDAHQAARWARESEALFVDQLARADLVLLSKLDLASAAEADEARALIARLAPDARVVPCVNGAVDPALLLGLDPMIPPAPAHGHQHALVGETILVPGPVARDALEELLERLSGALFRIKGVVAIREPAGPITTQLVQCVGDQITLSPLAAIETSPRLIFIGPAASVNRAQLEGQVAEMLAAAATCR